MPISTLMDQVSNERMLHHVMEKKRINLERAELKDRQKIKGEKWLGHFDNILLQQLKMVLSSLFGLQVPVCMPENAGA